GLDDRRAADGAAAGALGALPTHADEGGGAVDSRTHASAAGRALGVVVLLSLSLFPFYWMLSTAVDTSPLSRGASLLPSGFTLEHFRHVLIDAGFLRYVRVSVIVALGTVVLSAIVALLAAVAVARFRFRLRTQVLI